MNRELKPEWQRGSMLVAFLNAEHKPEQKSRSNRLQWGETLDTVVGLVEALQKLELLLWEKRKKPPKLEKAVEWERELERERLETSINRMIGRHRFRPVLSAYYVARNDGQVTRSCLEVRWLMANKPRPSRAQRKVWEADRRMSNIPIDPTAAIQIALEMATAGTLDRVRRCRCGLWFLAAPSLKKSVCGDPCRFEKYRSKKGYKENRREYMRNYMRNARVKVRRKLLASKRPQKKAR